MPNPLPSGPLVVKNGSKIFICISLDIPTPVSEILNNTRSSFLFHVLQKESLPPLGAQDTYLYEDDSRINSAFRPSSLGGYGHEKCPIGFLCLKAIQFLTLYYDAAILPERGLTAHVWVRDGEEGVVGHTVADRYKVLARYPETARTQGTAPNKTHSIRRNESERYRPQN